MAMLMSLEMSERVLESSQELFFQNNDPYVSPLGRRQRSGANGPAHLRDQGVRQRQQKRSVSISQNLGGGGGGGGAGARQGAFSMSRKGSRFALVDVDPAPAAAVCGAIGVVLRAWATKTVMEAPPLPPRAPSDTTLSLLGGGGVDLSAWGLEPSEGSTSYETAVEDTEDVVLKDLLTEDFAWGDMTMQAQTKHRKRKSIASVIDDGEDLGGFGGGLGVMGGSGAKGSNRRRVSVGAPSAGVDVADSEIFVWGDFEKNAFNTMDDDMGYDEENVVSTRINITKPKETESAAVFQWGDFACATDDPFDDFMPASDAAPVPKGEDDSKSAGKSASLSGASIPSAPPPERTPKTDVIIHAGRDKYGILDAPLAERTVMRSNTSIVSYDNKYITGHSSRIKSIVLTVSAKYFVVTSISSTIVANYEVRTGKEMQRYQGHVDVITNAIISRDDKLLSTSSRDNTIIVWDFQTARQLYCFHHPKGVIGSTFSKNGHFIVTGCQDWQCRLFSVRRKLGSEAITTYREHTSLVTAVCFEPNGENVVSGGADTYVRVWNAATGATKDTMTGHRNAVLSVVFSPNGKYILSTDSQEFRLWSWDAENMKGTSIWAEQAMASTCYSIACFAPGPLANAFFIILQNEKRDSAAAGSRKADAPGMVQFFDFISRQPILSVPVRAPVNAVTRSRNLVLYGDSVGNIFSLCLNSNHEDMAKYCN